MDLFTLVARLSMDTGEFERGVTKSQGIFSRLGSTVSAGTVAMGNLMSDALKKGAQMVVDLGKTGIEYNAQMEDYTASFRTMLGSTEAAAAKVEALKEFAAKTPFEMTDLASATQTLLAFGVEAEKTDSIMKMLGNVSLGNSQKFSSLALAFGQVSSTGKLMGQDLLQMINSGFNPLQVIAEKTGASMGDLKKVMSGEKTSKDFQKMIKAAQQEVKKLGENASEGAKLLAQIGTDGQISAEMVEGAFRIATSEGGRFFNGMEENSKTLNGLFSTLKDNWTSLVGDVFRPASDFLQSTLLPLAISAVDKLSAAYDAGGLEGMLGAAADLIAPYVEKAFTALNDMAGNAVDTGANILAGVYNGLTGGSVTAQDVKLVFSNMWDEVGKTAGVVTTAASSLLGDVYTAITGDAESGQKIKDTLNSVFEDPLGAIGSLVEKGKTLLGDIFEGLSGEAEAQEGLKAVFADVFGGVRAFFDDAATQSGTILSEIAAALTGDSEGAEAIKQAFSTVFDDPVATLNGLVTAGGSLVADIATALGADTESSETIAALFVDFFTRPLSVLQTMIDKGSAIITEITSVFSSPEKRAALIAAVEGAFKESVDFISSLPGKALEWGKSLIENFVNGLLEKWEALKAKVSGVASSIKGFFSGGGDNGGGAGRSFAVGLDYVPTDNYPATLHRGEAVLTRSEAEEWRAGKTNGGTTIIVNQYINSEAQTAADLMREARWEQERGVLMGYAHA